MFGVAFFNRGPASSGDEKFPPVLPPGPAVALVPVATADQPVGVFGKPGAKSGDAVLVVEKTGRVRPLVLAGPGSGSLGAPLLDLSTKVSTANERGLWNVAFSPTDPTHLYVTYAGLDGAFVLSEFNADGSGPERELLRIAHPNDDHYGGALAFDDAGLLYVSVGDGGGVGTKGLPGDRDNNAQNLKVLLGKVLRIDPRADGQRAYRIPGDNPFVNRGGGVRGEIWAYGLRNPYRISIHGGDLWIGDVGQSQWEEVNRIALSKAGANFGWKPREGRHPYRNGAKPIGALDPVFEYAHSNGRCAVIGGAVAGSSLPGLDGDYVFGDLCTGRLMALQQGGGVLRGVDLGNRLPYLTFVGRGDGANLYATSLNGGVYRIDRSS